MSNVIKIEGRAVPVVGDDIDTDRIIPARYLKEITFTNMGAYPFYDERFDTKGGLKPHAFNEPRYKGASLLVGNVNFGCGSSREHAPQALVRWGIKAIVAESLAEIFAGNCVMLGVPAVTLPKANILFLQKLANKHPEFEWILDLESMTLRHKNPVALGAMQEFEPEISEILNVKFSLPESRRKALMEGTWDSTGILQANADKVAALVNKLPYINNFS